VTVGAEPANADLDPKRTAFLNALNTGDALAETVAYLDAGGDINAAIVPMINQAMLHYAAIEQRVALIECAQASPTSCAHERCLSLGHRSMRLTN
jgi:hypothetical protein